MVLATRLVSHYHIQLSVSTEKYTCVWRLVKYLTKLMHIIWLQTNEYPNNKHAFLCPCSTPWGYPWQRVPKCKHLASLELLISSLPLEEQTAHRRKEGLKSRLDTFWHENRWSFALPRQVGEGLRNTNGSINKERMLDPDVC